MRAAASAALLVLLGGAAAAECRQALALGLDVSGSVDGGEYAFQRDGLALALESAAVAETLLAAPEVPVWLAVFEWAGPSWRRLLVAWTPIDGPEALASVTGALRATARVPSDPSTAIGDALLYGAALLAERADCPLRTLDLSGDGRANTVPRPAAVKAAGALGGITVNALAVGVDSPVAGDIRQMEVEALRAYFEAEVIHGPGAFVETALGYADFEAAMRRKLLRELEGLSVSEADAPVAAPGRAGERGPFWP